MIGNALRIDIEVYAGQIDRNPLWKRTLEGRVTRAMVARYVGGLHFMLLHTPIHLAKARDRSRAMGHESLADFFHARIAEEVGHEAWAENDLRQLEAKTPSGEDVLETAKTLMEYVEGLIDENPMLYLSYAVFAEYFTVIKAPEWLAILEERCGIPRAAMTAIGKHAELDRDHAEEAFAVLDDLITDPKMLAPMRQALAHSIELFEAYGLEATTPAEEVSGTNVVAAAAAAAHVSAA